MQPVKVSSRPGLRARAPYRRDDGADLVEAAVAGDRDATEELFAQYAPLVRRILHYGLGLDVEAEDLVQDVFLNLLRDLPKLRDPRAVRGFIVAVTANILKNELRRRKLRRLIGLTTSGELPEPWVPEGASLATVALARFYGLLDGLSATNRTIFVLRQFEGTSLPDVGEAVGLSLATVKRRLKDTEQLLISRARHDATLLEFLTGASFRLEGISKPR